MPVAGAAGPDAPGGTAREVLLAFLWLGLTSFGGPVAHLGYFRVAFVERRRWLSEAAYAELVGVCQFLPGPASSQTGFALGWLRAGPLGGLAAWAGFTLPSAALMVAFAYAAPGLAESRAGAGVLHGLKLVAVAIVAQAVWGMARSLCPDRRRAGIALAALLIVVFAAVSVGQVAAIAMGAVAGMSLCRVPAEFGTVERGAVKPGAVQPGAGEVVALGITRRLGVVCLAAFAGVLAVVPLVPGLSAFGAFYRAGALVFGGGHVVLPLLRDAVVTPGWVSESAFLAGYGAAQAMPGPLFSFAAYLGAVLRPGAGGAVMALVAIFLPGLLLLVGVLPFWTAMRRRPAAQAAMRGVNAAVVGVLAAALYDPVWTSAVLRPADFAVAVAGFLLLTVWRAPPVAIVALGAAAGLVL